MWCIIGYILRNMVQNQFTYHTAGIYRTRTFIPEERERTGGYLAFFLQMIWFILIAIDLMIFLFQRLQKENLRSLPLIGGKVLILSFQYSPEDEVGFQMSKTGIRNVGLRIRSVSNLNQCKWEQNPSTLSFYIVSYLCTVYIFRFPCRQHSR